MAYMTREGQHSRQCLYCLHLEMPEINPWPARRSLENIQEFAAAPSFLSSPLNTPVSWKQGSWDAGIILRVLPTGQGKEIRLLQNHSGCTLLPFFPPCRFLCYLKRKCVDKSKQKLTGIAVNPEHPLGWRPCRADGDARSVDEKAVVKLFHSFWERGHVTNM